MIGQKIHNYKVIRRLGQGGMGSVYLAFDESLERHVALKVLNPELSKDKVFLSRFNSEAKLLAKLNHPNITILYNLVQHNNQWVMVMEYVDGVSIEQYLDKKTNGLKPEFVTKIVKEVLKGLDYAHAQGVIHRDIKPGNIMITKSGKVKLMDFGIALAKDTKRHTKAGNIVGSVHYISPELIRGAAPSPQSDIYSLGVVMYEMLEGKLPFESTNEYTVMDAHLNTKPPKITSDVPSPLIKVLYKSLNKTTKTRYDSAEMFLTSLQKIEDKKNTDPQMSIAIPKLSMSLDRLVNPAIHWGRRHFQYLMLGLSVLILGSVLLNYNWNKNQNIEKEKTISVIDHLDLRSQTETVFIPPISQILDESKGLQEQLIQLLDRAKKLSREKNYLPPGENLLDICTQIFDLDPNNNQAKKYIQEIIDYYLDEGEKLIKKSKWNEALNAFENVLKVDKNHSKALINISFINNKLNPKKIYDKKYSDKRVTVERPRKIEGRGYTKKKKSSISKEKKTNISPESKKEIQETIKDNTSVKSKEPIKNKLKTNTKAVHIQIKSGQKIVVRLLETIDTEQNRSNGISVSMIVTDNVYSGGEIAIKSGAKVRAILSAFKSSTGRNKGLLEIKVKAVQAADGSWVSVKRSTFRKPGGKGEKIAFSKSIRWEVFSAETKNINY